MNKEKAELLNDALAAGQTATDCNDPEISSLLEAGGRIKNSAFNNLAPAADFKERLRADILARRQTNTFSMKDKILEIWENWRSRLTARRLAPALAIIVLIALITATFKFWPQGGGLSPFSVETAYARDNFTVEPTAGGDLGVEADTQFIIKSKVAVKDIDSLRANIKLSPDTSFGLKEVSEYEFRLAPKDKLTDKRVYRLTIASAYVNENGLTVDHNYSWAFQVKDKFKVVGSIPANRTSAPANTGIEITFSAENFSGFETAFSIAPAVPGKFEKHKRTMVFVPEHPLATSTLYTVTVAPSVSNTATGEQLSEPYRFQFEIQGDRSTPTTVNFVDDLVEFSTSQNPAFSIYINNKQAGQKISTKVYNYRSLDDFTSALKKYYEIPNWASGARSRLDFDYSRLSLTSSYELSLANNDRGDYLVLPNNLPAGFYLIEAVLGDSHARIFVQVADVSAYTSITNNKILFWVNDIGAIGANQTSAAKVTNLDTKVVIAVDASGVVVFETQNKATTTTLFLVESAGKNLVVSVPPFYGSQNSDNPNNIYWSYLYTDRSLYQPTDEVHFWGFAKPRADATSTNDQEITVRLINDNLFDYYSDPMVVVEQKVKTDSQGFFSGSLKLNNLDSNNYRLQARLAGQDLYAGRYITVQDYIKPTYKINVTPSAKAIFVGAKINYQVQANFFEGTALADSELAIDHQPEQGPSENTTVVTDIKGVVNLEYAPQCSCQGSSCADDCYDSLRVTPKLSEKGEITGEASVRVFRTHIHFDSSNIERVAGANRAQVKTKLFNIDLNKDQNNWNGAPVAGKQVTAKITAIEYIPRQTGTYYDFINKVTYPVLSYDEKRTEMPDKSFVTGSDGSGVMEFDVNPQYSYAVKLLASDQYSNSTINDLYFSAIQNTAADPRYEYYNIVPEDVHNNGYNIGEAVKLEVKRNGQEAIAAAGRFLFLRLQNGLRDYNVSNNSKYSFIYAANDLPNIYVMSAWFDGRAYHEGGLLNVNFHKEERNLDITVKADKEKYRPGEEAALSITIKDKNGQGVKTHVNISAVDAAMAALGGISDLTPLSDLYRSVDSGWLASDYSHKNMLFGGGVEKGGGGGNVRSYFPDLALFVQAETGIDGKASVKFRLPGNITSWQISTQAISDNLEAGATTTQLKATLPFFVEANSSKQYLTGDEPIIKATAYGEVLNTSDRVQIYLEAPALGIAHDIKDMPAFSPAYFNLGKLVAGQYELKVGATYQNNQDAVVYPATVIDSRLSERHSVVAEIKTGGQIAGSDKNWTTLTFMDNNRGRYYSELSGLSYSDGARVDQKLSAAVATDFLNRYFSANSELIGADLKIYQTTEGGVSLLPYSSADLKISVLAAMTKPDSFNRHTLAGYFYGIYNGPDTNRDEMALALSGLAALNEPVLIPLREFSRVTELAPLDKLYLALGAHLIGDDQLAQKIYNELLTSYGEQLNPYLRLKIDDKNNDDNSIATAMAAVLAAGLNDSRAESFWNYAKDNRPNDYLTNLEKLLYLGAAIPNLPAGDAKFIIKVGDREITEELKRGESYQLKVSPEQLKTLTVNVTSGNIAAVSDYAGAADMTKQNKAVAVSKSYFNKDKASNNFKESDIVEVRLKPQFDGTAVDGAYEITDILPSGLKLLTYTYSRDLGANCGIWYPYAIDGQRVKFIIDKNWNKSGGCQREDIRYFARVSQPGKYLVEPALIQSTKAADMKSFSSGGLITISQQ